MSWDLALAYTAAACVVLLLLTFIIAILESGSSSRFRFPRRPRMPHATHHGDAP
jgi:hypothetical protein